MKVITFHDIVNLNISPVQCYDWVLEMIKAKDEAILPPKISMKPYDEVFCNVMPSILPNFQIGGVKIVNRYPGRTPSLDSSLILMDIVTGNHLAIMDANWITAMRTGAVAVHSILLFARRGFQNISIMGLGNTARSTLFTLAELLPQRHFNVKILKYKQQEEQFMERFSNYENLHFSVVDNCEALVMDADVVISCVTCTNHDFCDEKKFKPGVLVIPIHTLGFTNCDIHFDKVFADDTGHVKHFKNFDRFQYFAEVCDVVNGRSTGRDRDEDRILVYNIGLSIHDIYFAYHIYEMVKDKCDSNIDLCSPQSKFWI